MPQLEIKQLVGELASQHGIRIDANDPAIAIVLLNRLVLQRSADELASGLRTGLREFEEAVQKVQTRAGQAVATEFNERAATLILVLE